MVSTQSAPASSSEKVPDAEADYQIGNTMLGTSASISRGESAVDVEAQPHNNEAQSQHDPIPPKAEAVSRPTSQPHFSDNREVIPELAPKTEVDWPTSPMNPFNWPKSKRIYHTTMPALFALVVTFASSVYTSAVPEIQYVFNVSRPVALLPFSLFLLGLAFGPVLAAPLSERFGRTSTYLISMPLFMLFTLGAGYAQTFGGLVACRLLAGLFASPPLVVGAGTNADLWEPEVRAMMTTLFALCPYLGPALGPLIGGFAVVNKGWRWTQWIILFFAVATFIAALPMKETYKKTIVQRHAKKVGAAPAPGPAGLAALKFLLHVTFLRPVQMLYSEPIVIAWSLYIGFAFAVLYSFFASFPYVYSTVYGFSIEQVGLTFISIAIGSLLGSVSVILVDRLVYQKQAVKGKMSGERVPPEQRLHAAMMGSVLLPLGLFWYGWTAREGVHWLSSVIAAVFIAWGNLCIFMSGLLYLLDVYEALMGASAVAATSLLRYVLAAAFPLFINDMYQNLGVGWATSTWGFISIAMMPIPWVLYIWGPGLRAGGKLTVGAKA